jgi:tetratricopeptide (TPR) repeat protein
MSRAERLVMAALFATMTLFGIASYWRLNSMWGINHLQFLSSEWWYGYWMVFGFITVLTFVFRSDKHLDRIVDSIANAIFDHGVVPKLVLALAAGTLFYLFRMQTHFLGDGYTILSLYGRDAAPEARWTEVGSMWLVRWVQPLSGEPTRQTTLTTIQLLSIMAGMVVIYNCIGLVSRLCLNNRARLLGLITCVTSGMMLLYFGYVEYYPLLWASGTTFFNLALRYFNDRQWILAPLFAVSLAVVFHLQAVYLIAGVAYLLMYKLTVVDRRFAWHTGYWLVVTLLAAAGAVTIVWLALTRIDFEVIFLPPFVGRPPATEYAALSPKHMLDILNLTLVLLPGLLALLLIGTGGAADRGGRPVRTFLLWSFAGSFLFLLVINPVIGMARDWDLMSFTLFPLMLLLIHRTNTLPSPPRGRLVLAYAAAVATITASYLWTNIDVGASETRFHNLLRYYATKDRSGWSILANHYNDKGDRAGSSEVLTEMDQVFPEYRGLMQAYSFVNRGDYKAAYPIVDSLVRRFPYNPDFLQLYANCLGKMGRFAESEEYFRKTVRLRPHNARIGNEFGQMLLNAGALDKALTTFRTAHATDPSLTFVLEGLGLTFFKLGRLDSALAVADTLFAYEAHSPGGHLIQMIVAVQKGDLRTAREHLVAFRQFGVGRSDYKSILEYYAYLKR